ncbi:MAG TPA: hypothetical protein DD733_03600, partial [Clostridiales bacterium]|nr:hypothetical protein [Clostridiales bacterium]
MLIKKSNVLERQLSAGVGVCCEASRRKTSGARRLGGEKERKQQMTLEELKIRQLTNQYLITQSDKITVVRDLLGVQAQFLVNALHSLKIRCYDYDDTNVSDGLVKNWSVRGTVHVLAEDDLPLFKHCDDGKNYRMDEWRGYLIWQRPDGTYNYWDDGGCKRVWSLTPERQKYFSHIILDAVSDSIKTRDELKEICSRYGMTEIERDSMFDQWGGGIRDLCERGYMNYFVQEKKAYCLCPPFKPIPEKEAKRIMSERYFTNIGPATVRDAAYFFGTTQTQVKMWLDELPVSTAVIDGKTYFYIENGKKYNKPIPECILLSGFDQLMLGYQKKESIYLKQEHLRGIFNLAGIVMPSILLRGNVVGKWQKKKGKLTFTLFENISKSEMMLISNKAES